MGLYRRGKIYWFSIKHDGKRLQGSTRTDNRKLAEKLYARVLIDVLEGKRFQNEAKRHTYEEFRDKYMREYSRVNKSPNSYLRDVCSFKKLGNYFTGLTLAEITPARISEYKSLRLSEGIKTGTLAKELELLRHACGLAIREWEWMEHNPFLKVKIEKSKTKIERWITIEEEKKLLSASSEWLREIILFALNTGMRRNEVLTLQWSQVDIFRRTVTLLVTKNREKRTIPLNQTVLGLLKAQGKIRHISGFVFASEVGSQIHARNLLRAFYLARKRAGLDDVRFHDLRHTFATRLVQAGVDLYKVKELLGHKTISMTMRYAHHYPESLRSSVDVLDKCYNGATVDAVTRCKVVGDAGFEPATPAV